MKKQTKRTRGNTQTYSIEDITGFSRRDEGRKINNHLIETYLQQVRDYPYTVERFVRYLSGLAAITIMLKKDFEKLAKYFKIKLRVVLTKGDEPVGNGIGPILELIDVIKVLNPSEKGPEDLEKKSLYLSGQILEMTGKAKAGKGFEKAKEILDSGMAFAKFLEIIKAQKGSIKNMRLGKFKKEIFVKSPSKIIGIDNLKINSLARLAGCPVDNSSGLYLHVHLGDKLRKKDKLLTIYAESKPRLKEAMRYYLKEKPIKFK